MPVRMSSKCLGCFQGHSFISIAIPHMWFDMMIPTHDTPRLFQIETNIAALRIRRHYWVFDLLSYLALLSLLYLYVSFALIEASDR